MSVARRGRSARPAERLAALERRIVRCRRCPELRAYCAEVAATKRRAYADEDYWGKPVPGHGTATAPILVLGLAPAAHGANRTGRMFTGDRSGDFLHAGLHRAGLANQAEATGRDDGLRLADVWVSNALRCAPPGNKPTPEQLAACTSHLDEELAALTRLRVVVCLGGIAWKAALDAAARAGCELPRPKPKFGHAVEVDLGRWTLLGCYHVSQQNTFTGRMTPPMLDDVLARARALAALPPTR